MFALRSFERGGWKIFQISYPSSNARKEPGSLERNLPECSIYPTGPKRLEIQHKIKYHVSIKVNFSRANNQWTDDKQTAKKISDDAYTASSKVQSIFKKLKTAFSAE